jgi:poly(3-hydroxyalkanoate) synthetase
MCFLAIPGLARQQRSAWWVTAQFEATDTTIEGIPAKDLDRTSVAAIATARGSVGGERRGIGEKA